MMFTNKEAQLRLQFKYIANTINYPFIDFQTSNDTPALVMSKTSIFLQVFVSTIISVKSEYVRHRDNILNKGVWIKADNDKVFEKSGFSDFIFKPASVNVDDLFEDDFYSFHGGRQQDNPFSTNYLDRTKRSPDLFEDGFRESLSGCNGKDCDPKHSPNNKPIIKSKFTPTHRNSESFYPYDVAVLLSKAKNNNKIMLEEVFDKSTELNGIDETEYISNETNHSNRTFDFIMANEILDDNANNNSSVPPKRSMNKNYESELIKKIEIVEGFNDSQKYDRNIFDDKIRSWPVSVPGPDVNVYKVIPKSEEHTIVSEKSLLKLLSILTKTFKKIMKQHLEIKRIHSEMFAGKEDIDKSVTLLITKFNDFETRYTDLKDYHEKIQEIQKKLESKEEYFKNKETEMSNNLADFENQQKKFLTQQRQFYNIQKLMLAQNEKINAKQSMIAKTQNEISRRQNNFARILKKAKQLFTDKKPSKPKSQDKITNTSEADVSVVAQTTTAKPDLTESVKIDLFSIPSMDSIRLLNQDQMILKEKDEHPVDDLVYKYYFNNTFIDNLMKNQIMSGTLHGNRFMTRNAKAKRNGGKKIKSTVLIPIDNNALDTKVAETNGNKNSRAKRWIRHHSKGKSRRRHRKMTTEYEMKDEKKSHPNANLIEYSTEKIKATTTVIPNKNVPEKAAQANIIKTFKTLDKLAESVERHLNPFTTMAANFCNQIGQNGNPQMLSWCIEKVLRKLQNIENIPVAATIQRSPSTSVPTSKDHQQTIQQTVTTPVTNIPKHQQPTTPTTITNKPTDATQTPIAANLGTVYFFSPVTLSPSTPSQMVTQVNTEVPKTTATSETTSTTSAFFPDNDELESNLKQFELTTDDEGTVFYDGSLHASDVLG
ncbi:uncharacterized protein LOC128681798 isoform X2 [Plodia interpunctella]|nr:uncharacterized protein LOC128681798 isoform X2 [Plodia interpunctella]